MSLSIYKPIEACLVNVTLHKHINSPSAHSRVKVLPLLLPCSSYLCWSETPITPTAQAAYPLAHVQYQAWISCQTSLFAISLPHTFSAILDLWRALERSGLGMLPL